ncbi:MAG: cbb3-type cytochrome c oxidase subunit I, partial [Pirellula sp.]
MSVVDRPVASPGYSEADSYPSHHFLNHSHGFLSWAMTLDHKRIGLMYLVGVMSSFALGGLFALMIRIHLWNFQDGWLDNKTYNQVFTLHGAIMVFLFIIPSVPAALGNFLLPIMLGTKDVAFPRLNLMSFYL